MKNLPLGINSLSMLRESDCIYVDKTRYIHALTRIPGRYFLSRPRRFGKSLFVDTLKELFEGNQRLFQGLYIHDLWDWSRRFPVIVIDFAGGVIESRRALDEKILEMLASQRKRLGVTTDKTSISGIFGDLIEETAHRYGQRAVVLVDEYDKPILDNIDKPDVAGEIREGLKNLYSVLKAQDSNLQFVFMTGVSKFSKVSLFSGINQLSDLTLDARYSALCGYTDHDLDTVFAGHLAGADRAEIRRWYNGYNWSGSDTVYNPFDILLFIDKGFRFRNYWFETGSPAFLLKLFRQTHYFLPDLENLEVSEEILESFEVERINPVTLLFQTGYLTIESAFTVIQQPFFKLRIPNFEVRAALHSQFITAYTDLLNEKTGLQRQLDDCLRRGDVAALTGLVKRLFAAIPWRNFIHSQLPDYEGYYASVLYAFFASLDATIIPEDISNHGQADMTVILGNHIHVMEFKVIDGETLDNNPALTQLQQRRYADKYRGDPAKAVHEVGWIFSRSLRGLVRADWDTTP